MLVVEAGKPFIHFWQAGHPLQTSRRILCPGKPGPAALSPNGLFLAVAIEEKVNLWQVSTGRIVTVINSAHYRPLTVLKWNRDGTFLITAGQDGMVLAWKFISLVSGDAVPK
jgi:pre-rRNA-processing protein IPI3